VVVALIAIGVVTYSDGVAFPGAFALIPTLGAALVLIGGQQQTATSRLLSVAPAVYIGRISYTLYLVHWPVNVFAHQHFSLEYTISVRVAMFLLSIALSMAIFHLVEHHTDRTLFHPENG
jgi:peptidoglycan/LPS O-acetylase OafA/YrhL